MNCIGIATGLFYYLTDGKKAIDGAILDIQRFTCVRFKERNKEDKLFLKFFKGKG